MKTLTPAIQKGGTGKSAITCQLAYYLHLKMGLRVLVIDLDHQGNSSNALTAGGYATVSSTTASQMLTNASVGLVERASLLVMRADAAELRTLEQKPDQHNAFATNLKRSLNAVGSQFDLCIIDVNPNPDIRHLSALVVSDFVLSPVQLAQESIDGIGAMLNDPIIGVRKIQATINPRLKLLGILPNLVEPTPFQKTNFADLCMHFGSLLIPLNDGFAAIKKSTAVFEAQATGAPIWKSSKSSSRAAWQAIEPVFDKLSTMMNLTPTTTGAVVAEPAEA